MSKRKSRQSDTKFQSASTSKEEEEQSGGDLTDRKIFFPKSILRKTDKVFRNDDSIAPKVRDSLQNNKKLQRSKEKAAKRRDKKAAAAVSSRICGAQFPVEENRDFNNNAVEGEDYVHLDTFSTTSCVTETEQLDTTFNDQLGSYLAGGSNLQNENGEVAATVVEEKVPENKFIKSITSLLYKKIFSYLNQFEIHNCAQVCKLWKQHCDTLYNPPIKFNGRSRRWNSSKSLDSCRQFLTEKLLSSDVKRHYELFFYNVENTQLQTIEIERADEFNASVRHLTRLHLVNCNLRWTTLVSFLQRLPHLRTFTDTWSCHYHQNSCVSHHASPEKLKKIYGKLVPAELKTKYQRIRVFKVARKSFSTELCVYLHVIRCMYPHMEEFELTVGPWKTPKSKVSKGLQVLNEFVKIFQAFLHRTRKDLKKLSITCNDASFDCLFDKCVEALHSVQFQKLRELSLSMNGESMRNPEKLPELVRFLNTFEWKERDKLMLLKTYISPIIMTKNWIDFLCTMRDRLTQRRTRVSFRFGVVMEDNITSFPERSTVARVFRNHVFVKGLKDLQVYIKREQTQSIREIIYGRSLVYPNIQRLSISVGERETGKCFAFRDYSIVSIAFHFKCLTELRLSDQPPRQWDILDCVIGKSDRASLTYAYISARDMVLLCEILTRLKVLQLWANLHDLQDINFTGIKSRYYFLHHKDGQLYLNKEESLRIKWEPCIKNLKNLEMLSLRGLGRDITDVTCRFAFEEMHRLKYIELGGDTSITQKGRLCLHTRMRDTGCKVNFHR